MSECNRQAAKAVDSRCAAAVAAIRVATKVTPQVGLVLGSGLGDYAETLKDATVVDYATLPGFPTTGVGGHAGRLAIGRVGQTAVAFLQGRAHYYERGEADTMAVPIRTLAALGCCTLVLTNAAGSLKPEWQAGSVVAISDHINFAGVSPLFGFAGDDCFVDMVGAYDAELRKKLQAAAKRSKIALPEGVFAWVSGPQFETPAEIRALGLLGANLVGMSTVPEVILARHAGMRVAALSLVTNLAAGLAAAPLSHAQTLAAATDGGAVAKRLLTAFLEGDPD
ncbi:MAG: purine-nucleoside phosphorylase [Kiloniellales bacterium]